jgi:hypothetical protein
VNSLQLSGEKTLSSTKLYDTVNGTSNGRVVSRLCLGRVATSVQDPVIANPFSLFNEAQLQQAFSCQRLPAT